MEEEKAGSAAGASRDDAEHLRRYHAHLVERACTTAATTATPQGKQPMAGGAFYVALTRTNGMCGMASWALLYSILRRASYASADEVPKGETVCVMDAPRRRADGRVDDPCGRIMHALLDMLCEWAGPSHYDDVIEELHMTRREWMETYVLTDLHELRDVSEYPAFLRQQFHKLSASTRAQVGSQLGWIGQPAMTILSSILDVRVETWVVSRDDATMLVREHVVAGFKDPTIPVHANKIPYRFLRMNSHYVPILPTRILEAAAANCTQADARARLFNARMVPLQTYIAQHNATTRQALARRSADRSSPRKRKANHQLLRAPLVSRASTSTRAVRVGTVVPPSAQRPSHAQRRQQPRQWSQARGTRWSPHARSPPTRTKHVHTHASTRRK